MRKLVRSIIAATVTAGVLAGCASQPAPSATRALAPGAVIGVREDQLTPEFWIHRDAAANHIVLDTAAISAQNAKLQQTDSSVQDIEHLPAALTAAQVRTWIETLSERPANELFDERGNEVPASALDALMRSIDLEHVPATQTTRYGLVVRRSDLRTFPTRMRVFSSKGNTDIDRFQENALFPGTPVAIVHESSDHQWWFVVSKLYAAWIEKSDVAEGSGPEVFAYGHKTPYVVVTGATAKTVFTPERPEVSELQLDMGVRVPLRTDWPAGQPVNGQDPYTAHVIELPMRGPDGALQFTPALLPKTADVATDYLPLNRENILRQGFKFLGERYGWGHSYNARDCSGFVSDVYRSFGVQLPRNTRDQGVSPAFNRIAVTDADSHAARLAVLNQLQVGDLVYIPGHVMMVIGHDRGVPYVIHDTTGFSYRNGAEITRVNLNGVSVTPLTPLLGSKGQSFVDGIYSIQRIRP
jgi:hypothetical protein